MEISQHMLLRALSSFLETWWLGELLLLKHVSFLFHKSSLEILKKIPFSRHPILPVHKWWSAVYMWSHQTQFSRHPIPPCAQVVECCIYVEPSNSIQPTPHSSLSTSGGELYICGAIKLNSADTPFLPVHKWWSAVYMWSHQTQFNRHPIPPCPQVVECCIYVELSNSIQPTPHSSLSTSGGELYICGAIKLNSADTPFLPVHKWWRAVYMWSHQTQFSRHPVPPCPQVVESCIYVEPSNSIQPTPHSSLSTSGGVLYICGAIKLNSTDTPFLPVHKWWSAVYMWSHQTQFNRHPIPPCPQVVECCIYVEPSNSIQPTSHSSLSTSSGELYICGAIKLNSADTPFLPVHKWWRAVYMWSHQTQFS